MGEVAANKIHINTEVDKMITLRTTFIKVLLIQLYKHHKDKKERLYTQPQVMLVRDFLLKDFFHKILVLLELQYLNN